MRLACALLAGLVLASVASSARADRLHVFTSRLSVYAADGLSGPLQELIAASGIDPDDVAQPVLGPSGALRARIEAGAPAALFVATDLDGPKRLETRAGALPAVAFAGDRVCVLAPRRLGLAPSTLLDRLLDPRLRLAIATPGVEPAGDEAAAMFARAYGLHPGAAAVLGGKAQRLLGAAAADAGPTNAHSPAAAILIDHKADALIDFCSVATAALHEAPDLAATPLPAALAAYPVYGLVVLHQTRLATRLALFALSAKGQSILADAGLLPLLPAPPK